MALSKEQIRGILFCTALAFVATYLGTLPFFPFTTEGGKHPVEPVMIALLLGIALRLLFSDVGQGKGIEWSMKAPLALGVVLMGARINFLDIMKLGLSGGLLTVGEVAVALLLMAVFARFFKLSHTLALLLGIGTAICGGSAIIATAPLLEAKKEEIALGVTSVTLVGLLFMMILPLIGNYFLLNEEQFGILAGLSIHQTPQVIAAGFSYGARAGEVATIVKLARVCLLAPLVMIISFVLRARRGNRAQQSKAPYPTFVIGFLLVALFSTLWAKMAGTSLPYNEEIKMVSAFALTVSMAAVGFSTNLRELSTLGLKPFIACLLVSVVILTGLVLFLS